MKLSIITINYNNQKGLKRTLDSVSNQIFKDFEFIVIDGGSSDGSYDLLVSNDLIISKWISEPDKGVYHAMNKGIIESSGEYLLFLNSGDEFFCTSTLQNVHNLLHSEDIITGDINFISDKCNYIGYSPSNVTFIKMYKDTLWHPCSFIRKDAFNVNGLYDEQMKVCGDWKWFIIGIFKNGLKYRKIDLVISKFYLDGLSSRPENIPIIEAERRLTLEDNFPTFKNDFIEIDNLLNSEMKLRKYSKIINLLDKYRIITWLTKLRLLDNKSEND